MRAITRVVHEIFRQQNDLPRNCAIEARSLLIGNINKQAFLFRSYSESYRKWKTNQGYALRFWILEGDVLSNIRYFRYRRAGASEQDPGGRKGGVMWMAGIPGGVYDSGGKNWSGGGPPMQIALYARFNEFGTAKTPARPVFTPTALQYKKQGYLLKQGGKTLVRIKDKWK